DCARTRHSRVFEDEYASPQPHAASILPFCAQHVLAGRRSRRRRTATTSWRQTIQACGSDGPLGRDGCRAIYWRDGSGGQMKRAIVIVGALAMAARLQAQQPSADPQMMHVHMQTPATA